MAERGDEFLVKRLKLFCSRKDAVRKQIGDIQKTLNLLEFKCWYYEQAIHNDTEEKVHSLFLAEIPKQYRNDSNNKN